MSTGPRGAGNRSRIKGTGKLVYPWNWLTRWILGSSKEAEERTAQTRFARAMGGAAESPVSPRSIQRDLDRILLKAERKAAILTTVSLQSSSDLKDAQRLRQSEVMCTDDLQDLDDSCGIARPPKQSCCRDNALEEST
jgi:hypothetical protein